MKKLLVGGLERIFQIAPAFRAEPPSSTHSPEFTLLEWYRSHASLEDIFNDTENLIVHLATQLKGSTQFHFQGTPLDVTPPWPRWTTQELFTRYCGIDLATTRSLTAFQNECKRLHVDFNPTDTWDDLYFRVWLNVIEPKLPTNRAFFVTAYPGSQAALAVKDRDSTGWETARRFECYLGGIELANAFEELTDPVEQRKRFEEDMELRQRVYGSSFPKSPIDEEFLLALKEGLPPSGGIALGVDRLVMIFADEPEIQFTFWIPPTL